MRHLLKCTVLFLFIQIILPHAALSVTDNGLGPGKTLSEKPDILIVAYGSEELSALFKAELESTLIRSGFHTLSTSQIPELDQKMDFRSGSVKRKG